MAMKCECCGNDRAVAKYISRSFGSGDEILVVDRIPIVVCSSCGGSYLTAETLHELERLRMHASRVGATRHAPVLEYV